MYSCMIGEFHGNRYNVSSTEPGPWWLATNPALPFVLVPGLSGITYQLKVHIQYLDSFGCKDSPYPYKLQSPSKPINVRKSDRLTRFPHVLVAKTVRIYGLHILMQDTTKGDERSIRGSRFKAPIQNKNLYNTRLPDSELI